MNTLGPPSKRILIIEDDQLLNKVLSRQINKFGYHTDGVHSWSDATTFLQANEPDLILLDGKLPDADGMEKLSKLSRSYPVIMLTAFGSIESAVTAIKLGASEYLAKPVNLDELELTISKVFERAQLKQQNEFFRQTVQTRRANAMVGSSKTFHDTMELIKAVAPTDATVLVLGESGVGKELVAKEIHNSSERSTNAYVAIDCCTIQENLFESELFGHERGAFTGADRQKKGLVQIAEGGTLFLDEIGEISPALQAKLLRVLETGVYRRVGGTKNLVANVRIIAATNKDLFAMSQVGTFRSDLYYRLSAFHIEVPPLRERQDDIPALCDHFIEHHSFSRRIQKRLSIDAQDVLCSYPWPGNIRELKNVIERAIILSREDTVIETAHLGLSAVTNEQPNSEAILAFKDEPTIDEMKLRYINFTLEKCNGNRRQAAKKLGISERNLYRLLNKQK